MRKILKYALICLGGIILLAACNLPGSAAGATLVWIDVPLDGLWMRIDEVLTIEGHAACSAGTSRVEIWVNDALYQTVNDPPRKGELSPFEMEWAPPAAGDYIFSVIAFGMDGSSSAPDTVTVHVSAETDKASPTFTLTSEITGTATVTASPELTLTATVTPSATATTQPSRTPTFRPTDTEPPPPPPPEDTTPPPVPGGQNPNGNPTLPCSASVPLSWGAVSDDSGIGGYKLEIQRSPDGNAWSAHPTSPTAGAVGTSFNVQVECGWSYRWRVKAIDNKGNQSNFSDWAVFTVTLT